MTVITNCSFSISCNFLSGLGKSIHMCQMLSISHHYLRKLCLKGRNESPRHLHNTNFGALNNLLQKELLIRALYTHLIEEGGEESGKET